MEKKNNNFVIAFLVIVILLLCGVVCYFAFRLGEKTADITDNDGNNNVVTEKENIDYSTYVPSGLTLDKVVKKELALNGENHVLAFVYSYQTTNVLGDGEECNNCSEYTLTVVYDEKVLNVKNTRVGTYRETDKNNIRYINLDNVKVMKDTKTDKEYIMAYYNTSAGAWYEGHDVIIISDEGNILYSYEEDTGWGVSVSNEPEFPRVQIDENSVVVLTRNNCDDAFRNKVTIENGSIKTERIDFTGEVVVSGGC